MDTPPERIELPDLLLRRWTDDDAGALLLAVQESYDELHPWMPWAGQPPVLADMEGFVRLTHEQWAGEEAFLYGIFDLAGGTVYGATGLHRRIGPGGLDIGYWLHTAHTGRGIATRTASVLTREAFALPGIDRVEIHTDVANTASAAVPKRLGYRMDRIEDHSIDAPAETGRRMIWVMPRTI